MASYELTDHHLILKVKRVSFFLSGVFYFFAALSFLLPLVGVAWSIGSGNGWKFGHVVGIIIAFICGFYFLRMALWNTCGREILTFHTDHLEYCADYGWFKDARKKIPYGDQLTFASGTEDDGYATLVIIGEIVKPCVTKMKVEDLNLLLNELAVHPVHFYS